MTDHENLVGAFVVIAKKPELHTEKGLNTYYDGEYVVISQTAHAVIGMKVGVGAHDTGETRSFLFREYDVLDPRHDDRLLETLARDMEEWATGPERGEKRQWVESVYSKAKYGARRLRLVLDERRARTRTTTSTIEEKWPGVLEERFTRTEWRALQVAGELAAALSLLRDVHPDEHRECVTHLHDIQKSILARTAYPLEAR